jgi:hypothetical protein
MGIFRGKLGIRAGLLPARKSLGRGAPQGPMLTRKGAAGNYKFPVDAGGASYNVLVRCGQWRRLFTKIRRSIGVFERLLHRSVCTRLLWETGFGLDDYAATGMTAGLLWAGKGMLLSLLARHLRIRPAGVRIAVVPRFGRTGCSSTLDCVLETSLGYIIVVAFKLGAIWLPVILPVRIPLIAARRRRRYA